MFRRRSRLDWTRDPGRFLEVPSYFHSITNLAGDGGSLDLIIEYARSRGI